MKLDYHPLIKPYANAFVQTIGGVFGWRLIQPNEFQQLINLRGGNDRIAFAAGTLKDKKQNFSFSFQKSVAPLVDGSVDHIQLLALTSQQLLGHCWEILKHNNLIPVPEKAGTVFEFYRHVRNGAFHGNRFFFEKGKPPFRAEWQDLAITEDLHEKRVFRDSLKEKEFFLNYGDPLLLLSDVSELLRHKKV